MSSLFSTGYVEFLTMVSIAPGDYPWNTPTEGIVQDATLISTGLNECAKVDTMILNLTTYYLKGTGCEISLNAGSMIRGLNLRHRRSAGVVNAGLRDSHIQAVLNNVIQATNKSLGANWVRTDALANYDVIGGDGDMWGITDWISEQDLDAGNFGVAIRAASNGSGGNGWVDCIKLDYFYNPTGLFMTI